MRAIRKFMSGIFGFAAGFTFLIYYVTALGQNSVGKQGAGKTLLDSATSLPYDLKMIAGVIICVAITYWLDKKNEQTPQKHVDEGFMSLLSAFCFVAITCALGLALSYGICIVAN